MELIKHNYNIENFGEVYLLMKLDLLSKNDVLKLSAANKIKKSNKDRTERLEVAAENLFDFYALIKQFIIDDNDEVISFNEDSNISCLSLIPQKYWSIYKLELILQLEKFNLNKTDFINEIGKIYQQLNHPEDWRYLIHYFPDENNVIADYDHLYSNYEKYKGELDEKYR